MVTEITIAAILTAAIKAVAAAVISLAVGALTGALFKKKGKKAQRQSVKLNSLTAEPPYRRAYGVLRIGGTITERRVSGRRLYMQVLVHSSPSAGPFDLYLDSKLIPLSGDPYDFSGDGAVSHIPVDPPDHAALFDGHVRCWIGRGEQNSVPGYLVAEHAPLADAPVWPGSTVVWLSLNHGPDSNARDRWPNGQPQVNIEGRLALLYDPRDPGQDAGNPSTWGWSDNQALVALDMVRHEHCIGSADDRINFESFIAGADICDLTVAVAGGGSEQLYRASGIWEADGDTPFEMIEPCMAAGMSTLTEVDGQWRYIPGRYQPPEITYGEDIFRGPGVEFVEVRDPADMSNTARVTFLSPERAWEMQPLAEIGDPDALAADNGRRSIVSPRLDWVTSKSQAYRIGMRTIRATRRERAVRGAFHPKTTAVHFGSYLAIDCPTIHGGTVEYVCQGWAIGFEEVDRETATARTIVTLDLQETGPEIDQFDPDLEPDLEVVLTDEAPDPLDPPVIDRVEVEVVETAGGTAFYGRVYAAQSATESAVAYHTRFRKVISVGIFDHFSQATVILAEDLAPDEDINAQFGPLAFGTYEVQMRMESTRGLSPYASEEFTVAPPADPPAPPQLISATTGDDHTTLWRTPDDPRHERLVIWSGDPSAGGTELQSVGTFSATDVQYQGSGGPGVAVAYYATSRDVWGNDSLPAGPATHTTAS